MIIEDILKLYNISRSTFDRYMDEFKELFDHLATRYRYKGKTIKRRKLNRKQVTLIVKVMQDTPEGHKLKRGTLIKLKEYEQ